MPLFTSSSTPSSPTADFSFADRIAANERRLRRAHHARRVSWIAAGVAFVGLFASFTLSTTGVVTCRAQSGEQICRRAIWYPLSLQKRLEIDKAGDVMHGLRREWHPDGTLWMEGTYDHGARVGVWREWHPNGVLRFEGTFARDRLVGMETWYFDNGQKEWQVRRVDGQRDGEELWWYRTGALHRVGSYARGERQGSFVVYGDDGQRLLESRFEHGAPMPAS